MKKAIYLFCALVWCSLACNKEGVGGKASIQGVVRHGTVIITDAIVYIKYGADNFPGFDSQLYDDNVISASDGSYSFRNLYKGDYYLYVMGFDATINESVSGGVGVKLEKKRESKDLDIAVEK
ncbi:MAG: hypothetical protein JKY18_04855 [Flavobacteriales bacterium]|nr:hypothetical protein [Flavobacteriales bacterium]MBL4734666.1 hypothetical protein [Flavobacteriales bacterium]